MSSSGSTEICEPDNITTTVALSVTCANGHKTLDGYRGKTTAMEP